MTFGRSTGLWADAAAPPARTPRSIPDSPERPLPLVAQVGRQWQSFDELKAQFEKEDLADVEDATRGETPTGAPELWGAPELGAERARFAAELISVLGLDKAQTLRLRNWMETRLQARGLPAPSGVARQRWHG